MRSNQRDEIVSRQLQSTAFPQDAPERAGGETKQTKQKTHRRSDEEKNIGEQSNGPERRRIA